LSELCPSGNQNGLEGPSFVLRFLVLELCRGGRRLFHHSFPEGRGCKRARQILIAHLVVVGLLAGPGVVRMIAAPSGRDVGDVDGRDQATTGAESLAIPTESEWTDYGTILEPGGVGDWDLQLSGAFAGSAIKLGGTYYLYYLGACCYRISDDTPTFRAVGVATSPDGINFTKHSDNPVLTWWPNNGGEEGAVSSAVVVEGDEVVFYYGANTEETSSTINADARLATSNNGLTFTDRGLVLDHSDPSIWGHGDELYPIIAIEDGGQWVVYYIPHGPIPETLQLGVAAGPDRMQLSTSPATSGGGNVTVWGMGGAAKIGPDTYALFLNYLFDGQMFVHTVSLAAPQELSLPVETYSFPDFRQATVLLDEEISTWFMYYRNARQTAYGVKLAPAGSPDTTPPMPPQEVTAVLVGHDGVDLAWEPASDAETGIVQYKVFRDGSPIATVKGWRYSDRGLSELTTYSFAVSAVNTHGLEGVKSSAVEVTTLSDRTAPDLASVSSSGDPTEVTAVFDEPVDETSSETAANYKLNHGATISAAALDPDLETATLSTSPLDEHRTYTLTTVGVEDRAQTPNAIEPPIRRRFTHSGAAGLVGCWRLDEGEGETAFDTSNFAQDGTLDLPGADPAIWTAGKIGGGLQFDGVDDIVTIPPSAGLASSTDGSHTFSIWARPVSVPPATAADNTLYSLITRERTGLYYTSTQTFMARIRLADGSEKTLESPVFSPGLWHHLTMVVDEDAQELRLYVDNVEVVGSPVSYTGALASHGEADFFLGTSDTLTEKYDYRLDGTLDEARVYSRALEISEIVTLASDPSGPRSHTLLVELAGEGSGSVTSTPEGIDCGSDCEEDFGELAPVGLTAVTDTGSDLAAWDGDPDCRDGQLTMYGDRICMARFCIVEREMRGLVIDSTITSEACNSLAVADVQLLAPAEVTLRAGREVILRDGFSVASGAKLVVVIDPSLSSD
jgi:hypothetical protein